MTRSGPSNFFSIILQSNLTPVQLRFLGRSFLGRRFQGRTFLGRCFLDTLENEDLENKEKKIPATRKFPPP